MGTAGAGSLSISGRPLPLVVLAAFVAVILALTLVPQEAVVLPGQAALGPAGLRGLADSLANVLLFLPLGLAAAFAFRRRAAPALLGALLSTSIELAQLVVPGRYPSPWDVLFNTAGAALGGALASHAPLLLRPGPRLRRVLGLGSLAGALLILGGGAALFQPAATTSPLVAEWTPVTRTGHRYSGRVTSASLGAQPLPPGPISGGAPPVARLPGRTPSGTSPMDRILKGQALRVAFLAGPPPPVWVPLFRASDGSPEAALTIGIRGNDVALDYRTRAARLHLDQPDLRLAGALAGVRAGDPVSVMAWGGSRGYCLQVNTRAACAAPAAGQTWALLLFPVPQFLAGVLPWLWLALLLLPAGFWSGSLRSAAAFAALAIAALLFAARFALAPPPLRLLIALTIGLYAGHALGQVARRRC